MRWPLPCALLLASGAPVDASAITFLAAGEYTIADAAAFLTLAAFAGRAPRETRG